MELEQCRECWYLRNSTKCCSYLRGPSIKTIQSCPRNGPLVVDKKLGYVIVCTDEMAREGSFLFWKPEGRGYTSDIDQAGIWADKPEQVRDIIIPLNILLDHFKTKRIVVGTLFELQEFIKGKKV